MIRVFSGKIGLQPDTRFIVDEVGFLVISKWTLKRDWEIWKPWGDEQTWRSLNDFLWAAGEGWLNEETC